MTGRPTQPQPLTLGFTLVELIVVIVIGAVVAATLTVFFRPAITAYFNTRDRATLLTQADLAVRRMVQDVRIAVPNSIRIPNSNCFELMPTSSGGRYRSGPDVVNDSAPSCSPGPNCSAVLDTTQSTSMFDVLSPLSPLPAVGDYVVIGNSTPAQVYGGSNRASITAISTPLPAFGTTRLSITPTQFPLGDGAGRFAIVPANQGPVFYVCSGADGGVNADGDGKGTLYRLQGYGFNSTQPSACPSIAGADVLATQVLSCRFIYDPNQGATQQSGFVSIDLALSRRHETAHLLMGAHIANAP